MCIIISKSISAAVPSVALLTECWDDNPDGAGYAFRDALGRVHVRKGFLHLKDFLADFSAVGLKYNFAAAPMIVHFRISTAGGVTPGNTHPFTVSEVLAEAQALRAVGVDLAFAHNGMIEIAHARDVSDTCAYIQTLVAPLAAAVPDLLTNAAALHVLDATRDGSRFALLGRAGDPVLIGPWVDHGDGLKLSHTLYTSVASRGLWPTYSRGADDLQEWENMCTVSDFPGAYLKTDRGVVLDGTLGFYFDRFGMIYSLWDADDGVTYEEDLLAYTADHRELKFDQSRAVMMPIETWTYPARASVP